MVYVYLSYDEIVKAGLKDKYVKDPVQLFYKHGLVDDEITRKLLQEIEHGEYCDTTTFYDRFGRLVYADCMSNGCKVAIACAHNSENVLDLSACGLNARDAILNYVDNASVLIYASSCAPYTFDNNMYGDEKQFIVNGYKITGVTRLGCYLEHEYPDLIDWDEYIEEVN
jgi:hypothetical protein